jgi:hypothetical protein
LLFGLQVVFGAWQLLRAAYKSGSADPHVSKYWPVRTILLSLPQASDAYALSVLRVLVGLADRGPLFGSSGASSIRAFLRPGKRRRQRCGLGSSADYRSHCQNARFMYGDVIEVAKPVLISADS